jgi:hypothetical protein
MNSIKDKPSPQDYNPNTSFIQTSGAAWRIGNAKRPNLSTNES